MAKTDLSDVIHLLQFTGHYFNFDGYRHKALLTKLQKFRLLYMLSCNPFTLSSLFIGGLKKSMGIELFFGLMGFLTVMQHIHVYIRRAEIEEIIQTIKDIRQKYQQGSDAEFEENTRVIWKVVQIYFIAMSALIICYIILPKFVDLMVYGILQNDPVAHRLPMSMDAFLDEQQHRNLKYLFVSITSIAWSIVSTYSHFGLDSLLCLVGFYYSSLIKTFCDNMHLNPSKDEQGETTNHIKMIAAQHHELHKLYLKIRSVFGFPFTMQNNFGAFCIVSLFYALLSDDSGGLVMLIANVFNLILITGMLTSTATVGQHVTDQSSAIFDALYNLPWYALRPADRKYFVTMICAARVPFTIHYHGRAPLNLANFMAILNTSYSYFMFMKSTF